MNYTLIKNCTEGSATQPFVCLGQQLRSLGLYISHESSYHKFRLFLYVTQMTDSSCKMSTIFHVVLQATKSGLLGNSDVTNQTGHN